MSNQKQPTYATKLEISLSNYSASSERNPRSLFECMCGSHWQSYFGPTRQTRETTLFNSARYLCNISSSCLQRFCVISHIPAIAFHYCHLRYCYYCNCAVTTLKVSRRDCAKKWRIRRNFRAGPSQKN